MEIAGGLSAKIFDLTGIDMRCGRVGMMLDIRGADERELPFVGDREHDAPIACLEDVGVGMFEKLRHDDVAALHEAQTMARRTGHREVMQLRGPRAGGIDHRAGDQGDGGRPGRLQRRTPSAVRRRGQRIAAGAGRDHGAALCGIERIEHHEPCIVHPAVRILETADEACAQGRACRVTAQVDAFRAGELAPWREVIVEEEPGTDHPRRSQRRVVRHHEA